MHSGDRLALFTSTRERGGDMLHAGCPLIVGIRSRALRISCSRTPIVVILGLLVAVLSTSGLGLAEQSPQHSVETLGRNPGLPKGADSAVSTALGADNPAYQVRDVGGGMEMVNSRHGLSAVFTAAGVEVVHSDSTRFGMSLLTFGRGETGVSVSKVLPFGSRNRVEYRRATLTEWYTNGPFGLEQGFTVWERPAGDSRTPLTVSLAMSGNVPPVLNAPDRLTLGPSLRYSGLVTVDATGRELPSSMELRERQLLVHVDDANARYPITIDPTFQQVKLTASDGVVADHFGLAVAISSDGNTIVAGAEGGYWQQPGTGRRVRLRETARWVGDRHADGQAHRFRRCCGGTSR
jgi:hypothetical protein